MIIFINDEKQTVESGVDLSQLLHLNDLSEKKGIAVALNGSVVSRSNWNKTELKENDKILIISATRGG
ncbi:MAG: sulfur carrier protein ThiS [Rhodothermaceae bacterium]